MVLIAAISFGVLLAVLAGCEIAFSFDLWLDTGSDADEHLQDNKDGFQDMLFNTEPIQ